MCETGEDRDRRESQDVWVRTVPTELNNRSKRVNKKRVTCTGKRLVVRRLTVKVTFVK